MDSRRTELEGAALFLACLAAFVSGCRAPDAPQSVMPASVLGAPRKSLAEPQKSPSAPTAPMGRIMSRGTTTCALRGTELTCWGGRLIDPKEPWIESKDAIDFGLGSNNGCALSVSGGVSCWDTSWQQPIREQVPPLPPVKAIVVGGTLRCALTHGREVRCWRGWTGGEPPLAKGEERLADIEGIAAGWDLLYAWSANSVQWLGRSWPLDPAAALSGCKLWRSNGLGMLIPSARPEATEADCYEPQTLRGLPRSPVQIAASHRSCAVLDDGSAWCWGRNDTGAVGDGTTVDRPMPTRVVDLPPVARIAVGRGHACAATRDGGVACWGAARMGQIGDVGKKDYSSRPIRIAGLSDVVDVAADDDTSCALRRDGAVYCWGKSDASDLPELQRGTPTPTLRLASNSP